MTDEQRAHRAAYMYAYRRRPENAERKLLYAERARAKRRDPDVLARNSERRRLYVQRKRDEGVHTETHLTRAEFDAMVAAQGGVCAICHEPETKLSAKGRVRRLSIDHDHRTGRVRALLCARCNSVVGYMNDDPRLGDKVVAYMRQQEGLMIAWAMEEAVGMGRPVVIRRHRVPELQRALSDAMERAVG